VCLSSSRDLSLPRIIYFGSTDPDAEFGLYATGPGLMSPKTYKSVSPARRQERSKMWLGPLQGERNIVHLRVARVTVVLSINNFIYQLEEHLSSAGSITAESFIFMYR
jgi:hypothetical protein